MVGIIKLGIIAVVALVIFVMVMFIMASLVGIGIGALFLLIFDPKRLVFGILAFVLVLGGICTLIGFPLNWGGSMKILLGILLMIIGFLIWLLSYIGVI